MGVWVCATVRCGFHFSCLDSSLFSVPFYSFVFPHCISTSMYLSQGLSASFLPSSSFLFFHSHSSVFIQSAFIQPAPFPIFCVPSPLTCSGSRFSRNILRLFSLVGSVMNPPLGYSVRAIYTLPLLTAHDTPYPPISKTWTRKF